MKKVCLFGCPFYLQLYQSVAPFFQPERKGHSSAFTAALGGSETDSSPMDDALQWLELNFQDFKVSQLFNPGPALRSSLPIIILCFICKVSCNKGQTNKRISVFLALQIIQIYCIVWQEDGLEWQRARDTILPTITDICVNSVQAGGCHALGRNQRVLILSQHKSIHGITCIPSHISLAERSLLSV